MIKSRAPLRYLAIHKASGVPLSPTNGRIPALDKAVSPLVSFFVAAFNDPSSLAFATAVDFVWSYSAAVLLPLVEPQRIVPDGSHSLSRTLLGSPLIWGLLYQRLSGGWIMPLWLLAFMHSPSRTNHQGISRIGAESVFVGWWLGHTLPAIAMVIPGQHQLPWALYGYVAFPALMPIIQQTYLFIRRNLSSRIQESNEDKHAGYFVLQVTYISAFTASCLSHIHLVVIPAITHAAANQPTSSSIINKVVGLLQYLYRFYIPATGIYVPSVEKTTAASGIIHFVQMDILVVFSAVWMALLWDLNQRRQDLQNTAKHPPTTGIITRWNIVALVVLICLSGALGPGAATAALMMYRERKLEKARTAAWKSR
jgi:hypothetical protein